MKKTKHQKALDDAVKKGLITPFSIPDNVPKINYIFEDEKSKDVFPADTPVEQIERLKTDKKYFEFMAKCFGGKSNPEKGRITLNNMIENWDKDRAAGIPIPPRKKTPFELMAEDSSEIF